MTDKKIPRSLTRGKIWPIARRRAPAAVAFRPVTSRQQRERRVRNHRARVRHGPLGRPVPCHGVRAARRVVPRPLRATTRRDARRTDPRLLAKGPYLGVADDRANRGDGRADPASDRAGRRRHRPQPRRRAGHAALPAAARTLTPLGRGGLPRRDRLQEGAARGGTAGVRAGAGRRRSHGPDAPRRAVCADRRRGAAGPGGERGPARLLDARACRGAGGGSPRAVVVRMVADRSRVTRAAQDAGEDLGGCRRRQRAVPVRPSGGHTVLPAARLVRGGVPLDLGRVAAPQANHAAGLAVEPARPALPEKEARGVPPLFRDRAVPTLLTDGPFPFHLHRNHRGDTRMRRYHLIAAGLVAGTACARPAQQAVGVSVVTVTATDYAFNAPDTIPAGRTAFRLVNQGKSCTTLRSCGCARARPSPTSRPG